MMTSKFYSFFRRPFIFRYEIRLKSDDPTDFECIDVNECNIQGVCHRDGNCRNYPGSYSCSCNRGFIGDGLTRCLPLCECTLINNI